MEQTIFRCAKDKENPYVMISKAIFEDKRLSWKAKGIMGYLLSRPNDWKVIQKDLINRSTDGDCAVRSAIQELESFGYMKRIQSRDGKGQFSDTIIEVHEWPTTSQEPQAENPHADSPQTENQTLLSTNITNKGSTKSSLGSERPSEKSKTPDIHECELVDDTDKQITCFCGENIRLERLNPTKGVCPHCKISMRVRNSQGKVIIRPSQKARRQESGGDSPIAGFDHQPLQAFCSLYDVPREHMPPKKVKQWGYQIKSIADIFGADTDITDKAIKLIKDSEHSWETYKSPYQQGFIDLLGKMIMRVQKGDIDIIALDKPESTDDMIIRLD